MTLKSNDIFKNLTVELKLNQIPLTTLNVIHLIK
jgi:hypothetical protein